MTLFGKTRLFLRKAKSIRLNDDYYDYIISTSDPKTSHLFAKKIIKTHRIKYGKWIQHWGDPLAGDVSKECIYPEIIIRQVEEKIIKSADRIVYVSPLTLIEQKKKYNKYQQKMMFAPLPCVSSNNKSKNNKIAKPVRITYSGDYNSKNRNIKNLYDFCKQNNDIALTIAGTTDLHLEECSNIKIYGRITQEKSNDIEKSSDILTAICNKRGSQIPGKIYYMSSTNKPILVIMDGENEKNIEKYLRSFKRFHICKNDQKSIEKAINEILYNKSNGIKNATPRELMAINIIEKILK